MDAQTHCADLRCVHTHLRQGTRPSKKLSKIGDIKQYLNHVTIARDGLLVVRSKEPFNNKERIVIPRSALSGLLTALHLQLIHPTTHQLKTICLCYIFALDVDKAIDAVSKSCHQYTSLMKTPHFRIPQSTSPPPTIIGGQFYADVIQRERQHILVVREDVTSFTWTTLLNDEKHISLREGLLAACLNLNPLDGPPAIIRTDSAPGFRALCNDPLLTKYNLTIGFGNTKKPNKNPVAEKAVQEVEEEMLKIQPGGGIIFCTTLSICTSNLNSRIRQRGISSREILTQREQFNNTQVPVHGRDIIVAQYEAKVANHPASEKSKAPNRSYKCTANNNNFILETWCTWRKTKTRTKHVTGT